METEDEEDKLQMEESRRASLPYYRSQIRSHKPSQAFVSTKDLTSSFFPTSTTPSCLCSSPFSQDNLFPVSSLSQSYSASGAVAKTASSAIITCQTSQQTPKKEHASSFHSSFPAITHPVHHPPFLPQQTPAPYIGLPPLPPTTPPQRTHFLKHHKQQQQHTAPITLPGNNPNRPFSFYLPLKNNNNTNINKTINTSINELDTNKKPLNKSAVNLTTGEEGQAPWTNKSLCDLNKHHAPKRHFSLFHRKDKPGSKTTVTDPITGIRDTKKKTASITNTSHDTSNEENKDTKSGGNDDTDTTLVYLGNSPVKGAKNEGDNEESKALLSSKNDRRESEAARSKWTKLKNTIKITNALSSHNNHRRKHGLEREDSFIKRFSTRQGGGWSALVGQGGWMGGLESPKKRSSDASSVQINSSVHSTPLTTSPRDAVAEMQETKRSVVIGPDSGFIFMWLFLVATATLYNLWSTIAREAFFDESGFGFWLFFDIFADAIYVGDIFVQARTGFLDNGLIVTDTNRLLRRYITSRSFLCDVISLLPLDLLQFHLGIHPILRFPRFLKVYRLHRLVHMVETRAAYPNLWRVANLSHVLFLGCHWFAAFYYLISRQEDFSTEWGYPSSEQEESLKHVTQKYLRSLYWSTLILTTIGDMPPPETTWEFVFTILSYLIGVFVFATIVGQVGNVITNQNASRLEFEKHLDGAKVYMRSHNVPSEMQKRVQRWYDYAWSRGRMNGGGDINSLGLLPDKLKTELALHVNLETLKKVTLFHECEPEFLHDLVLKMRAYIFTPGDMICRKGEIAREMFIIADGVIEVVSENGDVLKRMVAGDFFGEIGILNLDGFNKRTADVRSVGYSELFVLSRVDILNAFQDYAEAEKLIKEYGKRRLQELSDHQRKADQINKNSVFKKLFDSRGQSESPQISTLSSTSPLSTTDKWLALTSSMISRKNHKRKSVEGLLGKGEDKSGSQDQKLSSLVVEATDNPSKGSSTFKTIAINHNNDQCINANNHNKNNKDRIKNNNNLDGKNTMKNNGNNIDKLNKNNNNNSDNNTIDSKNTINNNNNNNKTSRKTALLSEMRKRVKEELQHKNLVEKNEDNNDNNNNNDTHTKSVSENGPVDKKDLVNSDGNDFKNKDSGDNKYNINKGNTQDMISNEITKAETEEDKTRQDKHVTTKTANESKGMDLKHTITCSTPIDVCKCPCLKQITITPIHTPSSQQAKKLAESNEIRHCREVIKMLKRENMQKQRTINSLTRMLKRTSHS